MIKLTVAEIAEIFKRTVLFLVQLGRYSYHFLVLSQSFVELSFTVTLVAQPPLWSTNDVRTVHRNW